MINIITVVKLFSFHSWKYLHPCSYKKKKKAKTVFFSNCLTTKTRAFNCQDYDEFYKNSPCV